MKNGSSSTPAEPNAFPIRKVFQASSLPSGVRRAPSLNTSDSNPAASARRSACRMSEVRTAHVTRRGSAIDDRSIGKLNVACSGSGAIISRYCAPSRERSALHVPTPGWTPPTTARAPTRSSSQSIPRSRLTVPSRRWSVATTASRVGVRFRSFQCPSMTHHDRPTESRWTRNRSSNRV